MDQTKILVPQDYQKFFHMSSEGLVWLDKKGNPIPLSQLLDMHVETIDPSELWNSIQMRNRVHKQNFTDPGTGPTNSMSINLNVAILLTPTSPTMDHDVEARHPEGASMTTVKELLEDPQIQLGMMQSALSTVTSPFTPSKILPTGDNNLVANKDIQTSLMPSTVTRDVNRELNEY